MKFILTRGSQAREELAEFPLHFRTSFGLSRMLVLCMTNDNRVAGACGIISLSNYIVVYVKEEYRRQGLGPQIFKKTIRAARSQGLSFILASAPTYRMPILYFLRSIAGFREIIVLDKSNYVILMRPLTDRGELLYAILRGICSKLPESVVSYSIDFFMYFFDWIRVKIIGSM